jgi:hypothetical protein
MKDRSLTLLTVLDLGGVLFSVSRGRWRRSGPTLICSALWCWHLPPRWPGIIRDLLIGAVPPSLLRYWRYSATALSGAVLVFFLYRVVQANPNDIIIVLDTAGLALFAAAGTEKALVYEMHPFVAVLLGTLTGVGAHSDHPLILRAMSTRPQPWLGRPS